MTAKNDITGDILQSRMNSKAFEENFDRIFRRKETFEELAKSVEENEEILQNLAEYELNPSTGEVQKKYSRMDIISQNGNEGLHYPESLQNGITKPNKDQFNGN